MRHRQLLAALASVLAIVALSATTSPPEAVRQVFGSGHDHAVEAATPEMVAMRSIPNAGGGDGSGTQAAQPSSTGPKKYPFYPMAGNIGRDIFVSNYADMDSTSGIEAFDCTDHTYNGHDAHDTSPRGSFAEQDIGIPIYAALDGYVTRVNDGEPDRNTSPSGTANYVQLYHGGGHVTGYLHMRKNSVGRTIRGLFIPWEVGDFIKAGTQIGLMASSGGSYGPHLHFSSHTNSAGAPSWNGTFYEPNTGACNSRESAWSFPQVNDPASPIAHGFTFSKNTFTGTANPPHDQAVRTGVFASGVRTINMRADLAGVAANDPWRMRIVRPDGSYAYNTTGTFPGEIRGGFHTWAPSVDLNTTGTWRAQLLIENLVIVDTPFLVNASGSIGNRAPYGVGATAMDPSNPSDDDVVFCRIVSSAATVRDLDYDMVRYRWQWYRNGSEFPFRSVTTASRSDAIPHHSVQDGDSLRCKVTPIDEHNAEGPSNSNTFFGVREGTPDAELDVVVSKGGTVTGNGISCPSDCSQRYEPGKVSTVTLATTTDTSETVTLTAKPKSKKWKFQKWDGDCAASGTAKVCTLVVDGPAYVIARFKKK